MLIRSQDYSESRIVECLPKGPIMKMIKEVLWLVFLFPDTTYILKGKATDSTYFHRIPSNLRSLVYSVGVKEGGAEEWNQAFKKYSTTHVASEKDILLDALTYTRNTQMIQKWV